MRCISLAIDVDVSGVDPRGVDVSGRGWSPVVGPQSSCPARGHTRVRAEPDTQRPIIPSGVQDRTPAQHRGQRHPVPYAAEVSPTGRRRSGPGPASRDRAGVAATTGGTPTTGPSPTGARPRPRTSRRARAGPAAPRSPCAAVLRRCAAPPTVRGPRHGQNRSAMSRDHGAAVIASAVHDDTACADAHQVEGCEQTVDGLPAVVAAGVTMWARVTLGSVRSPAMSAQSAASCRRRPRHPPVAVSRRRRRAAGAAARSVRGTPRRGPGHRGTRSGRCRPSSRRRSDAIVPRPASSRMRRQASICSNPGQPRQFLGVDRRDVRREAARQGHRSTQDRPRVAEHGEGVEFEQMRLLRHGHRCPGCRVHPEHPRRRPEAVEGDEQCPAGVGPTRDRLVHNATRSRPTATAAATVETPAPPGPSTTWTGATSISLPPSSSVPSGPRR